MEEYYIYKVNDAFLLYAYQYPQAIHQMARMKQGNFASGQHQLVFREHQEIEELMTQMFGGRNDYTYYAHTHYIRNKITGAFSLLKVYEHGVYLCCTTKFHIMKNIILQSDSNYVILGK